MIRPLQTTPHLMLTLSLPEFMKIAQTGRCRCESTLDSVSQLKGKGTILRLLSELEMIIFVQSKRKSFPHKMYKFTTFFSNEPELNNHTNHSSLFLH